MYLFQLCKVIHQKWRGFFDRPYLHVQHTYSTFWFFLYLFLIEASCQTKAKTDQNLYDFLMQNNISSFREQMFNQCASCSHGREKLTFLS